MIIIYYNKVHNGNIFKLWLRFYSNIQIPFRILCNEQNIKLFNALFPEYSSSILLTLIDTNNNFIELSEYDFLFNYTKNSDDVMILSNINSSIFKPQLIGRLFYVPIKNKQKYTTFEIPDFILYQHKKHTSYSINGLSLFNEIEILSDSTVCLCLKESIYTFVDGYYETNCIFNYNNFICKTIYIRSAYNIIVNKEKLYGIIWNPKCACCTIRIAYQNVNEIRDPTLKILTTKKYKYNIYLQDIDIIHFTRMPRYRFASCYFNKHVDNRDLRYQSEKSYHDYIKLFPDNSLENFANYTTNYGFIELHSVPITKSFWYTTYKNLKYINHDIDDNLNAKLLQFFSKYHTNISINDIIHNRTKTSSIVSSTINPLYKSFSNIQWKKYYNDNGCYPNYSAIIDDELGQIIDKLYQNDYKQFYQINAIDLPKKDNVIDLPKEDKDIDLPKEDKDIDLPKEDNSICSTNTYSKKNTQLTIKYIDLLKKDKDICSTNTYSKKNTQLTIKYIDSPKKDIDLPKNTQLTIKYIDLPKKDIDLPKNTQLTIKYIDLSKKDIDIIKKDVELFKENIDLSTSAILSNGSHIIQKINCRPTFNNEQKHEQQHKQQNIINQKINNKKVIITNQNKMIYIIKDHRKILNNKYKK
jgi:hypothetical protein